jgi:hypothetical protein
MATATRRKKSKLAVEPVAEKPYSLDMSRLGMLFIERWLIVWNYTTNHDRQIVKQANMEKGKGRELVDSMVRKGWEQTFEIGGISACPIEPKMHAGAVYATGQELIDNEMSVRSADLEGLRKRAADPKAKKKEKAAVTAYELTYCYPAEGDEEPKLKQIPMERGLWATTGHQRSTAVRFACRDRIAGGDITPKELLEVNTGSDEDVVDIIGKGIPAGIEDLLTVPVQVRLYANEREREEAQRMENRAHETGVIEVTDRDLLSSAQRWKARHENQQFFREQTSPSGGQKLWGICVLNARFPEVHLIERITERTVNADTKEFPPDYIPFKKIIGKQLPKLDLRSDPARLAKYNQKIKFEASQKGKQPDLEIELTAELLEECIVQWVEGTADKQTKSFDKAIHQDMQANAKNKVVRLVAKAHLANDKMTLEPTIQMAVACNAVVAVYSRFGYSRKDNETQGPYGQFERLLDALSKVTDGATLEKLTLEFTTKVQKVNA